ncbi:uncharacterized protein YecE (DUF72 family) [Mesorhizobium soli]|uniref:DUF72 domain-containing protein n=1 Tax=Pseudaminobacter soli (ex Li et al. 2025) TaxID=1295366 RepID=UPI002475B058|nr:DUF72 domain-containing protein [Mesorhizobium soli]MDH6231384.1 uncharacterized protein YecE (DUF72 family) [Mesorhizobium soli]
MAEQHCFIGTAGWNIAAAHAQRLPGTGTQLARYACGLNAVEIDSSFYRPHRRETYERWADSVPAEFRFSVKLPNTITHDQRLADCSALIGEFLAHANGLGKKLGVLLVQLPPSLAFDAPTAEVFLAELRAESDAGIALEPRHASWFEPEAEALLARYRVARVAADPAHFAAADMPAGWQGLAYFQLHGSPRVYHSDYVPESLGAIERQVDEATRAGREVWCIFDNTAQGHALGNALDLATAMSAIRSH